MFIAATLVYYLRFIAGEFSYIQSCFCSTNEAERAVNLIHNVLTHPIPDNAWYTFLQVMGPVQIILKALFQS